MPDRAGKKSAGSFYGILEPSAIDQEDVEQAVVVVVEQGDAAAHGFDQVLLRGGRIAMLKIQAGGLTSSRGGLCAAKEQHRGAETARS